jgi:hypothetical protein
MWAGVTARFRGFHSNLELTVDQIADGITKHHGVRQCLNRHYYESGSETANSLLIGSWGKETRIRPPRDVDVLFVLPVEVYHRFQTHTGNRQSALLQEVKGVLELTYPSTTMRGDGQVVLVRFNAINVEVAPCFALQNDQYWICDTNNGGRYKLTDPVAEIDYIDKVHGANNYNLRPIAKMLKAWQAHCSVLLKSFHVELLAAEFLTQSPWRQYGWFWYDWIMRDFFFFLYYKANATLYAPGTNEAMYVGDVWRSRVEAAYHRAVKACEYEYDDSVELAGEEWQKIFGPQIPQTV